MERQNEEQSPMIGNKNGDYENQRADNQNLNQQSYTYYDGDQHENPKDYEGITQSNFSNSAIRLNFIRKVYMIITCQLLFTAFIIYMSCTNWKIAEFQINNYYLMIVSTVLLIVVQCVVLCFRQQCGRKVPTNYILLFLFTFFFSYAVSTICAMIVWDINGNQVPGGSNLVITAAFLTAGITAALTFYACTTKTDFTMLGGLLWAASFLLLAIFILALLMYSSFLYYVYVFISLLLCCAYIIYDTQLIVGGEDRKYQLEIDDYIIGAMQLYADIILLFIKILELLLIANKNK